MMVYLFNILAAVFFTFFTHEVYTEIPHTALMSLSLFLGYYGVLWLFSWFYNKRHFKKVPMAIGLFLFYIKELWWASLKVTYDSLTPTHHMKPGVIAYPMIAKSDIEITLLANFITLTPGSLSIDISEDRSILYIHETYIQHGDIPKYKEKLRNGFEKRILEITR
ncbi:Na+/H+ antiporter subunit E [Echinicola jeungdonensis]|uniref:Na+/H+ antiporter subunit E n=1 Tax=Echinicola jeungdonensis TaxID=709343 RepID=A0ABV5J0H6_9BACT|nr:Na+/H+ antiporter subunit E [Echinicola jeungdonensis]MDN3671065.1 Na+/H+ antiporter subunit E [Echinicola jeungdonensis]